MRAQVPIRVCIIEDHGIVRTGLRMLLASHPGIEVVGEAIDRKSAFEVAQRESPDLFLVDVQLGTESAIDFLEELLALCDATAILLTGTDNEEQIHRAIEAGASGLVFKEEDPEVLIRAIEKVQAGEAWFSRSLMSSALLRLRAVRSSKVNTDAEIAKIANLTAREREIVALVATGLNRKKIAEKLFVSEATVRNHLTSIFGKLDVANQFDLVFYAQRHGLDKPPIQKLAPAHGKAG
jgi:two-component system nitrate/nitrite response regulator NarL